MNRGQAVVEDQVPLAIARIDLAGGVVEDVVEVDPAVGCSAKWLWAAAVEPAAEDHARRTISTMTRDMATRPLVSLFDARSPAVVVAGRVTSAARRGYLTAVALLHLEDSMPSRHLVPFLLALAACTSSTGPSIDLGDLPATLTIPIGREALIGTTAIRFHEVLEDSRCPVDVVCVWAGNARVQLGWRSTTGPTPGVMIELNSLLEPRSAAVAGLTLTMEGLTPEQRTGGIGPDSYRLRLRVEQTPVQAAR